MFNRAEVDQLVQAGVITSDQAEKILAFQGAGGDSNGELQKHQITIQDTLYYVGGFMIALAISYFLGSAWEAIGHVGRILATLILGVSLGSLGVYLKKTPYKTGGALLLLATAAVIPLFIHSVERAIGLWPEPSLYAGDLSYQNFLGQINTAWIVLDLLTLAGVSALFYKFKDPILTLPIAHFFWFLVLDGTSLITNTGKFEGSMGKALVSILAGMVLVYWGTSYHKRKDPGVGGWPWFYGLALIFSSLVTMRFEAKEGGVFLMHLAILAYALIVLYLATPLKSKTFLAFGGFALLWFVQDLSWTYFEESLGFSFVLILSGLLTIGAGVLVQKYSKKALENSAVSSN